MQTNKQTGKKTPKGTNIQFSKQSDKKALKPYCEQAQIAAENKLKADELRPAAAEYLQKKLDADPETKEFTGTVVCIFDDRVYKIRVQRPTNAVNWMTKHFDDALLDEYKALKKDLVPKQERAKELEDLLAQKHPKCITRSFTIAFLSK